MSEHAGAITGIAALAFDCAEPAALAAFWQRLLGERNAFCILRS